MQVPNLQLIVGPSGCGKTWLLLHRVLVEEVRENGEYDYVFILAPTIFINRTYMEWEHKDNPRVYLLEVSGSSLDIILRHIVKHFTGCRTCVVIDDMSNSKDQHNNYNLLTYLAFSGRHHGISLFVVSQKLNSVSTGVRQNATRVIFFRTHNRGSINILKDEFFGYLDKDQEANTLAKLGGTQGSYLDMRLAPQVAQSTPLKFPGGVL